MKHVYITKMMKFYPFQLYGTYVLCVLRYMFKHRLLWKVDAAISAMKYSSSNYRKLMQYLAIVSAGICVFHMWA